jgi:hypothetical protein
LKKNKNYWSHKGYKILEIFKKHKPEVLISKINQGRDVIKKNQITAQQQHGQTLNTISCKKNAPATLNPKAFLQGKGATLTLNRKPFL